METNFTQASTRTQSLSLSLSQVQWKIWDSHFRASLMKVKWELKMDHKSGLGKISGWGIEPFVNSILAFIT
jgi:hypothetical protein